MTDARLGGISAEAPISPTSDARLGGAALEAQVTAPSDARLGGTTLEVLIPFYLLPPDVAAGSLDSLKLEIEFTPGVWTDVSAWHRAAAGTTITQGRANSSDDGQPGTLALALENFDGRFTPDNATSAYFPNVVEGKRIRVTATALGGAAIAQIFIGYIRSWTPDFSSGSSRNGLVQIAAVDRLGQLARFSRMSDYASEWKRLGTATSTGADVWPLADNANATSPLNAGVGTPLPAIVVPASGSRGQYSLSQGADPLLLDGQITFEPDANHTGPVLLLPVQQPTIQQGVWFATDDVAVNGLTPGLTLVSARTAAGAELWSLRLVYNSGLSDLQLWVSGAPVDTAESNPGDGRWRYVYAAYIGGTSGLYYDYSRAVFNLSAAGIDVRDTAWLVLGGAMNPMLRGAQARCMKASFAGPATAGIVSGAMERWALPDSTLSMAARFSYQRAWGGLTGTDVAITGSDARNIAVTDATGRTSLDVLQEVARTIGGQLWVRPSDGVIELLTSDALRGSTAAFTITIEADDDASVDQSWVRGAAENPTRVTASTPQGDVTYIDAAAELVERRDGSVDTAAASLADGLALAAWLTQHGQSLRLRQIAVDAVTSATNQWTSLLTLLRPGTRVRVAGLDSAVMGIDYHECHVLGWTVTLTPQSAQWTFDTEPADSPAESTLDDATYGVLDFDDGNTVLASPLTSSATTVNVTIGTGSPMTTTAGDYPMPGRIGSEDITVSSPPAGATGTRTLTIVRSTGPVPAYAHLAGEELTLGALVGLAL